MSRAAPAGAVARAVCAFAGGDAELLGHDWQQWASATFAGFRHRLVLGFSGAVAAAAAEGFIDGFDGHEFAIPRWIVADAHIVSAAETPAAGVLEVEVALLLLADD